MRRLSRFTGLTAVVACLLSSATAHAQQSLNVSIGAFVLKGEGSRTSGDVLENNQDFLLFNVGDFNDVTMNGEWLVGLGQYADAGLGLGFYSETVPSVYRDFINDDNTEIDQRLHLRIVPFTATFRLLPLGRHAPIEPYIGAGVGVFGWKYSESGEFIDPVDFTTDPHTFVGSGTATGPVILGGVTFPAGAWSIGGEMRYQAAKGDLPPSETFAGDKIDLGGFSYLATFKYRF